MLNFIDVNFKNENGKTVSLRIFEKDEHGFLSKEYATLKPMYDKLETAKQTSQWHDKEFGALNPLAREKRGEYDEIEKEYHKLVKTLFTTDVFTNESVKPFDFEDTTTYFSLREENGYLEIDENTTHIPMSAPNITETAELLAEGGIATPKDIRNDIIVLKTDDTEVNRFVDIVGVGRSIYEDGKKTFDNVFRYLHKVHLINSENKKALELMFTAKKPLTFTPENIQAHINANLCGSAKQKAVMIVNKSSFAKIDIDVNGNPLITRDADGNFIYKHKYIVKEVSDKTLPNTETDESRIIIGDMSVVKFFVVRESYSQKDDFNTFAQLDKGVRKEIIALASTSDEVFIHGVLA